MSEQHDGHQRLRRLFEAACALAPAERDAYLDDACAGDTDLRSHVRRLLAADDEAPSFLAQPPGPPQSPDDPGMTGRRLGPYEIVREIGRGGMGTVYLAVRVDGQYRKEVAVKIVPASLAGPDAVRRFRQEQQILASLDHPHIAHLLDAGTTGDGVQYVVMEHVQGEPIDECCDRLRWPIAERLRLFAIVCDTVQYAHRNLVVHRDLKPSNILVSGDGTVKLLDFGIAKLLDDSVPRAPATRTGWQPMTPEYASPEQVTGLRVTTASDVYALGLLLYELLTGLRAHNLKTSSLDEIVRTVRDVSPDRPSQAVARLDPQARRAVSDARAAAPDRLAKQLAGDLDHIVLAAIRKEPERRYASAAVLADDVRSYLAQRPITAGDDAWTYRARKFVHRNAVPVAAAVVTLLALAFGLVATLWQAREAERARADAEVQREHAERRFDDVRRLATSFVFEFHDAIANLAGATPARQLIVSKGLEYLDSLAADAGRDRSLQRDLADAYDRMAAVQASPYGSSLGNSAASLESMKKAIAIREALVGRTPPASAERQALVRSLVQLGDAYQASGMAKEAVDAHRRVVAEGSAAIDAGAADRATRQAVAGSSNRLCGILLSLGDGPGALQHCQRSVSLHGALLAERPTDAVAREAAAGAHLATANALRLTQRAPEALGEVDAAIAALRALAREAPLDARLRQQLATALVQRGVVETSLGNTGNAIAAQAEAVEVLEDLLLTDPSNQRIQTLLSFVLLRRSSLLLAVGRASDAAASTERGLVLLRQQAGRSTAGPDQWNDYASWLLTCEPASERRPMEALGFARRAVAARAHPVYLDTLALAYFRNGDVTQALTTGEQALAMLPPIAAGTRPTGLRREIEGHLALFRDPHAPAARRP